MISIQGCPQGPDNLTELILTKVGEVRRGISDLAEEQQAAQGAGGKLLEKEPLRKEQNHGRNCWAG